MKITDFKHLIQHFPLEQQAFRVDKKVWLPDDKKRIINQYDRIKIVFGDDDSTMISRNDLFTANDELEIFVIKVLMWGYPTKGRGNNIDHFLEENNFKSFVAELKKKETLGNISINEVKTLLNFKGIKLSSLSKILYFKRLKIDSYPALILDRRVIKAINAETRFKDPGIEQFQELKYENGLTHYVHYLAFLKELATQMNVQSDQIEMFLFEFGSNLKEPKGDDGD